MSQITARLGAELKERETATAIVLPSPVSVGAPVKATPGASVLPLVAVPRRLSGIGPSATDRRH